MKVPQFYLCHPFIKFSVYSGTYIKRQRYKQIMPLYYVCRYTYHTITANLHIYIKINSKTKFDSYLRKIHSKSNL